MKKYLSSLAISAFLVTAANAGAVIDVEVGGGSWSTDAPTGTVDTTLGVFDLQDEAKLGSTSDNTYVWAVIDHPVPIVPNVRIEQVTLKSSGTNSYTVGAFTGSVDSELDLSNTDFILYWGVPFATWAPFIDELDIGIGVKSFSGGILMEETLTGNSLIDESFSGGMVPYAYGKLRIEPPFMMGIGIEGEIKHISYDAGSVEATFNETIIKADWGYLFPLPILDIEPGIEFGYREMSIDIDSSDITTDVGFKGLFFGAYAKFGI